MMFSSAIRNSGIIRKVISVVAVLALIAAAVAVILPAISSAQELPELPFLPECSDLIDNDGDGLVDWVPAGQEFGDPGCEDIFDDSEEGSSEPDPTPEEQCAIDEGFWNGESCEDVAQCDEGETYNSEDNTCTPAEDDGEDEETENNGGGSSNENTSSGGGSIGGGSLGGGGSIGGQVLGASTDEVCADPLITSYLGLGRTNDLAQVVKLQIFLNTQLGLTLPVTGTFGSDTEDAVEQFQLKYADEVLAPWVPFGLTSSATPTGYVYKTTKRMINKIHCAALEIPMPQLP